MFIRWGVNLPMSVGAIATNLSTIIVGTQRAASLSRKTWTLQAMQAS
jgi:hypothetical protein